MGCFDTITARCPACQRKLEFQTKGGECMQQVYALERHPKEPIPADVLSDVNRHAPIECACGLKLFVTEQFQVAEWPAGRDPFENPPPLRELFT